MRRPNARMVLGVAAVAVITVAAASAQQQPPTAGRAGVTPAGNADNGRKLYVKYSCSACHGIEGQGAPTTGPRIAPNPLPFAGFARIVRTPPNQMPPYTEKALPERELRDIYAYLESRPKPPAPSVLPD